MARDYSKHLWEIYEKLMSNADGEKRYIVKIDSGITGRIDKDSKDHKESLEIILSNLTKYANPNFWRVNDTVKGGDHTANVGKTEKGTTINKTSSTQGDRIYIIRYSDQNTGKIYVMLVGYQFKHQRDTHWKTEVKQIVHRHGGKEFDEEKKFNPDDEIPFDDHLLDWGAIYNVLEDGKIELTSNNKELLLNEANITITMEQFRKIAKTPPLLIDGHAGTGKSIIIALRIAFQYYAHHNESKDTNNTPRLLVVAYNERVLDMIQRYTTYWMERLIDFPESYLDNIQYIPTLKLYHSLVKENDFNSIPDPMSLQAARKFVNFFKFQKEFFQDIDDDSISAEQAWHFIRGILKGQGFGWYGWGDKQPIHIDDFSSITNGGKIPRKLTHRMPRELIERLLLVFERYENWRIDNGYIDDIDLIRKVFTAINAKDPLDQPKCKDLIGSFDNVLIDEAQDLTSKEFELLTYLLNTTAPRIVVGGDPLQTINPTGFSWTSLESFLYGKMEEGELNRAERMLVSHRLPKKLVDFSNVIIEARSLAKNENIELMQSAQKIKDDGFVARVKFNEGKETEVKIIEEIMMDALNSNVGILLWARDSSELDAISDTDVILGEHDLNPPANSETSFVFDIHSIESVKGLEYESIILYRFGDLDPNFNAMSEESLRDIKDNTDKNTYPILYHLNRLFIAASRAKKNIYIIDSEESLKKSWNDILWKNNISVDLTVPDFKEHINTESSLEKAELYFEKGRSEKNLDLLRKALASAMKCEDSSKQMKLVIQIRICLINLEIILAGDDEKEYIQSKMGELIDLYEKTENLLEATKMRANLEQWDEIRTTCKEKEAPYLKLFWHISCLDTKYGKRETLESLEWVLNHKKVWNDLTGNRDDQPLLKVLRRRIRFISREFMSELQHKYIEKLQESFGYTWIDIIELLKPNWDKTKSPRSISNNRNSDKEFTKIMEQLYGRHVAKLPIKGQIEYDKVLLDNPNITADAADKLIADLAKKGDASGRKRHISRMFEGKESFNPIDSIWPKILTILEGLDEENESDKYLLIQRLKHLQVIREAIFDAEKGHISNKWKPAIESFIQLSLNPSIENGSMGGLTSKASGMQIFLNNGDIWRKSQQIINLTPHLKMMAAKLITNLQTNGRVKHLLSKSYDEYLSPIFKNLQLYCETEIVNLVELIFNTWNRTIPYNSEAMLESIRLIDKKRSNKLRKMKDFISQVETFLLVTKSFPIFYKDSSLVRSWIYQRFQKKNKEHAEFNITFGRWKEGLEMPELFDIASQFETAKTFGDQHIIQSYANELNLNDQEMTDMAIKTLNFENISRLEMASVIEAIKEVPIEEIEKDTEWSNARWFNPQSHTSDADEFESNLLLLEEVSQKFLLSALTSSSFTQCFLAIYKSDFAIDRELPVWSYEILNYGHKSFQSISEKQSSKAEFWQLVERKDSFLDQLRVRTRTRYENVHLAMLACLETIFVFKKLKLSQRIQYLKSIGVKVSSGTKKADVTKLLFAQPFMSSSFEELENTEFDSSIEIRKAAENLLNN